MSHEKVIKAADQLRILAKDFITDDLANHPAIVAAEETGNDALLYNVASALLTVDTVLKSAINNVELMAQASSSDFKMDDLDAIASIANEFDNSKDPFLIKQAAVIDQLIMKLNTAEERLKFKKAQDTEINRLRAKLRSEDRVKDYTKTREQHDKSMKVTDAVKEIDKTFKQYRPLETALSTRTCPDHPGAQMSRIADNTYQCAMDHKIYNYSSGFTTEKGNKVPGGDVAEQTRALFDRKLENMSFSNREERLASNASDANLGLKKMHN